MKLSRIIILSIFFLFLFSNCDEEYDYEVNNTSWEIYVSWKDFYLGEPNTITFFEDGTTSWGGYWEKTDELTFKWAIDHTDETGDFTATYYAQFRLDLTELRGHCENSKRYTKIDEEGNISYSYKTGDFFAYKIQE
jgi:hypothetical protein